MSRAHVREVDGDEPEDLPELPLSPHPNYVTTRGLQLLEARRDRVEADIAAIPPDAADRRQRRAGLDRELRWLQARIAAAQPVTGTPRDQARVAFGAEVAVIDDDGTESRYRIVGEDDLTAYLLAEADRAGIEILDDVDVVHVVDAHLAYFEAIGAVGPKAIDL